MESRVLSVHSGRTAAVRIEGVYAKESRLYQPELSLQPEDVASGLPVDLRFRWIAEVNGHQHQAGAKILLR
jgi:hypothetical protein